MIIQDATSKKKAPDSSSNLLQLVYTDHVLLFFYDWPEFSIRRFWDFLVGFVIIDVTGLLICYQCCDLALHAFVMTELPLERNLTKNF